MPLIIFMLVMFCLVGSVDDGLYKQLWHACAGPLVNVPRQGQRVYYFPQGHMEQARTFRIYYYYGLVDYANCIHSLLQVLVFILQLEASMHQGLDQQLPAFDIPAKILCKVMNVQLRVKA